MLRFFQSNGQSRVSNTVTSRDSVLILCASPRASECESIVNEAGLRPVCVTSTAAAIDIVREIGTDSFAGIICPLGTGPEDSCWPLLNEMKQQDNGRQVFQIVLSHTASQDVKTRLDCFDAGAHMVTPSTQDAKIALDRLAKVLKNTGPYTCPKCVLPDLSEDSLHLHMHMHHATESNPKGPCPICKKKCNNLPVHIHNEHGPEEEREPPTAPYAVFSWCVCRRPQDGKFLIVNEPAGISGGRPGYWLPAGRVDRGETMVDACVREALEEGGVDVRVTGLLRFMVDDCGTIRVVFLAEPVDAECEPKSIPDWESVGAVWVDVNDLKKLTNEDYRSPDPPDLYPKVANGTLKPQSLNNDAFRDLEAVIQRLTASEDRLALRRGEQELEQVWKRIQATYPPSVFRR